MQCPDCGYMMTAFEQECSRCARLGKPKPPDAPSALSPSAPGDAPPAPSSPLSVYVSPAPAASTDPRLTTPLSVVPSPGQETVYLRSQDVLVTSARVVIGGKTYASANITSVCLVTILPNQAGGYLLVLAGGAFFLSGLSGREVLLMVIGTALLIGALACFAGYKTKFAARIVASSSETDGVWSYDLSYAQRIVDAVNDAIAGRG